MTATSWSSTLDGTRDFYEMASTSSSDLTERARSPVYEYLIAPDWPGLPFVNADRISSRFPGHESEQAYAAASTAAAAWRP